MNDYKKATYCGNDCIYLDCDDDQPCWGQVEVVEEEYNEDYSYCWWVYVCEGHIDIHDGMGTYIPKPIED